MPTLDEWIRMSVIVLVPLPAPFQLWITVPATTATPVSFIVVSGVTSPRSIAADMPSVLSVEPGSYWSVTILAL